MSRLQRITPWLGVASLAFAFATWVPYPWGGSGSMARALLALWIGVALLALGWWQATVATPGSMERQYALPVAVAAVGMLVAPMLILTRGLSPLMSIVLPWNSPVFDALPMLVAQAILIPLGVIADPWTLVILVTTWPLARSLARQLPGGRVGHWTRSVMVLLVLVLLVTDAFWGWAWQAEDLQLPVQWALAASITVLPAAVIAACAWRSGRDAAMASQRRLLIPAVYVGIGVVPAVAGVPMLTGRWPWLLIPMGAAIVAAVVLLKVAVLPLSRLAGVALRQRDLVVSAAEAERVRLAADIHDGPLADLALLIQDLDDRRDADGATTARAIATDLRSIGSDLQLPILRDLGVAPALEWLVARAQQRWGRDIALRVAADGRLPASVELAVYRIAQEAIRNAIEHGGTPVEVAYVAGAGQVTLTVDDAGSGLDPGAPTRAVEAGRLGLVTMAQRADTIGGDLTVTERPGGGTRVRLRWSGSS